MLLLVKELECEPGLPPAAFGDEEQGYEREQGEEGVPKETEKAT